ncbi:MAG: HAD family hydrolase [Actinomycetota bacterium]
METRAVIFDLFATLVPTFAQPAHDRVLEQIAELLGAPVEGFVKLWTEHYALRATGGVGIEGCIATIADRLGSSASDPQIRDAMELRLANARESMRPRPDAVSTLHALRRRGLRTGLISDCSPEPSMVWSETPFAPLIDVVVFSCIEGVCKPDPRLYLSACERLGVDPGECLFVGDGGSSELSGAAAVGMSAIQLLAFEGPDEPIGYGDVREAWDGPKVKSLTELVSIV